MPIIFFYLSSLAHCTVTLFIISTLYLMNNNKNNYNININTNAPKYISLSYTNNSQEKEHNQEPNKQEDLPVIEKNNFIDKNNTLPEKLKPITKNKINTNKINNNIKHKKPNYKKNTNKDVVKSDIDSNKSSINRASEDEGINDSSSKSYIIDQNLLYYKSPSYPRSAILANQQGYVVVRFLLSPDAVIKDIKLIKSSGYNSLDEEVKKTVRYWNIKRNITQDTWIQVTVNFKLKK